MTPYRKLCSLHDLVFNSMGRDKDQIRAIQQTSGIDVEIRRSSLASLVLEADTDTVRKHVR